MNALQFSFIASFLGVLISLFVVSDFIGKKLKNAGYDISRLILIGLPDNRPAQLSPPHKITIPWGFNATMTTDFDLKSFQEKGYAQGLAVLLALISCAFIYLKVGQTSKSPTPIWPDLSLTDPSRTQGRSRTGSVERVPAQGEDCHLPQHGHVSFYILSLSDVSLRLFPQDIASRCRSLMTFWGSQLASTYQFQLRLKARK